MVNDGKRLVFRFGDFELREREHRLLRAGEQIHLQPQVFRLLLYLVRNRDRVVEKDDILREVWDSAAVTDNSLTRSIYLLRKVLNDDPADSGAIRTVSSIGYQFVCTVEQAEDYAVSPNLAEVAVAIEESAKPEAPEASVAASAGARNHPPRMLQRVWLSASAIGILALLAAGAWYLHRPLPQLRITQYTQITHDGHLGFLGGTDGSRLYFTQFSPRSLKEVAVTGGEIAQIPVALPDETFLLVDVSPDGSSSLLTSVEKGNLTLLWSARLVDGSLRRLGSGGWPSYSPDGRSVAYTTWDGELWMMGSDGSGAHKVAAVRTGGGNAPPPLPTWSPDGSAIRFTRDHRFWEIAANGSNLHPLLPGWHETDEQCCGRWTPNGTFFVFLSGVPGTESQIWALDERRGLLRQPPAMPIQLTSGPTGWGRPVLSRDGGRIFASGVTPRGELSRYDANRGQFQPFLKGISADGVAFSKDGKSVAYVSYPEGILWKANWDGSKPVQLSQPPMYPMNPRWSPDGAQILFMDVASQVDRGYIVPTDGGSSRQLLPGMEGGVSDPNWSPDGKKILFATGEPGVTSEVDLRVLDVASGQVTAVPGSAGLFSPRWSPDGGKIAALTWQTATLEVYDIGKQQWSALAKKEFIEFPAFSADSEFIYYLLHSGDQAVYRVRVTGGEPERVVDLKDWHTTGHLHFWMALDPADAPLLLRDNGTSDLYSLTLEEK